MDEAIERLSFAGILDRSFRVLRVVFVPVVGTFAVALLPSQFISARLNAADLSDLLTAEFLGAWIASLLFLSVVLPWLQLATNLLVASVYLARPIPFAEALRKARTLYLPYLGTSFLMGVFLALWALLFLIPAVYFAVCWSLIGAIASVEEVFGRAALRRSRNLVRGHFLRTLGVLAAVMAVHIAASAASSLLFSFIPLLSTIASAATSAVLTAYNSVVLMVLYVDLRCRKEDFDLKLMASRVQGASGVAEAS